MECCSQEYVLSMLAVEWISGWWWRGGGEELGISYCHGLGGNQVTSLHGILGVSVADPNPDPPDPHVFEPPGSGSISQRYGFGSGSFYHHAK
jgi:hypothetical protein